MSRSFWRITLALLLLLVVTVAAQDPADSADHPAGNVNELTLAGLRPGQTTIADALRRLGPHWRHPSAEEADLYLWCDAHSGRELRLEAGSSGVIQVVTVMAILGSAPGDCSARLGPEVARTGRGIRLGGSVLQLKHVYGKPFFEGPSSWDGRNVHLVVFNFSWAGVNQPQILESSFFAGHLVKMTLSAQYY